MEIDIKDQYMLLYQVLNMNAYVTVVQLRDVRLDVVTTRCTTCPL